MDVLQPCWLYLPRREEISAFLIEVHDSAVCHYKWTPVATSRQIRWRNQAYANSPSSSDVQSPNCCHGKW